MARIELRYCTITLSDGLGLPLAVGGVGASAEVATTAAASTDTSLNVKNIYIPRAKNAQKIPVGARFTLASEKNNPVHVVQSRVQATGVGTNEKQTVTLCDSVLADAPTGGTFTLSFGTLTTIPIAYNASAAAVQAALNSLTGLENCFSVAFTAATATVNSYWTVEFQGALDNSKQQLLVG